MAMEPGQDLVCGRCGTVETLGETCSRCDAPLLPRALLPPWGGAPTQFTAGVSLGPWLLVAGLLAVPLVVLNERATLPLPAVVALVYLALLPLAMSLATSPTDVGGRPTFMTTAGALGTALMTSAVMTPVLVWLPKLGRQRHHWNPQHALSGALFVGALGVGLALSARLRRFARDDRAVAAMEKVPLGTAAAATEGTVHLAGTVRVERPVVAPSGARCAACEERPVLVGTVLARSSGGVFTLETADGQAVRVFAEHVRVADGPRDGASLVVPDGAAVEVLGQARWRVDEGGEALRESRRVLELRGTASRPLLLRVL
ncbi:MAG: hypothetical protein HY909_28610 [Deltaproteobacteria bacterium]|nr:hypothetical protein [Deltaproteobacteria bacterium]